MSSENDQEVAKDMEVDPPSKKNNSVALAAADDKKSQLPWVEKYRPERQVFFVMDEQQRKKKRYQKLC